MQKLIQVLLQPYMDVLSMGDFSTTHFNADDGQQWLRFQFSLLEDTYLF